MRTIVTLDPEFIPWAPSVPNVKLRRKHNKFLVAIMPVLAVAIAMGAILLYLNRDKFGTPLAQGGDAPTVDTAAEVLTTPVSEGAGAVDASASVPAIGKIGYLTLRTKKGDVLYECSTYRVTSRGDLVAHGNTLSVKRDVIDRVLTDVHGAFVDVRDLRRLVVMCDEKTIDP